MEQQHSVSPPFLYLYQCYLEISTKDVDHNATIRPPNIFNKIEWSYFTKKEYVSIAHESTKLAATTIHSNASKYGISKKSEGKRSG